MRRRKKATRESATQTEGPFTDPIVVLNRLSSSTLQRQANQSESCSISIRNPSIISRAAQQPVSRAPRNYRFFARPITNNQRANSTQVDQDVDRSAAPKKRVRFNRPGPLCSKRPREEVPITRSEVSDSESPPADFLHLNLDTVIEQTELEELTQFAEVVIEHSRHREEKKESCLRSLEEAPQDAPPEGSSGRKPSGDSSQEHEWGAKGKNVLIRADIVHIYNHFYNGV